jgi:hypothetical protein
MATYQVTVTVQNVPRLGSCTFTVEADSEHEAEERALEAMRERWAVGGTFEAQADEWEPMNG